MTKKYLSLTSGEPDRTGVLLHIKGKSGRDVSFFAEQKYKAEKEILFLKDTSLKVDKIKGNEIWLTEL